MRWSHALVEAGVLERVPQLRLTVVRRGSTVSDGLQPRRDPVEGAHRVRKDLVVGQLEARCGSVESRESAVFIVGSH